MPVDHEIEDIVWPIGETDDLHYGPENLVVDAEEASKVISKWRNRYNLLATDTKELLEIFVENYVEHEDVELCNRLHELLKETK